MRLNLILNPSRRFKGSDDIPAYKPGKPQRMVRAMHKKEVASARVYPSSKSAMKAPPK